MCYHRTERQTSIFFWADRQHIINQEINNKILCGGAWQFLVQRVWKARPYWSQVYKLDYRGRHLIWPTNTQARRIKKKCWNGSASMKVIKSYID